MKGKKIQRLLVKNSVRLVQNKEHTNQSNQTISIFNISSMIKKVVHLFMPFRRALLVIIFTLPRRQWLLPPFFFNLLFIKRVFPWTLKPS